MNETPVGESFKVITDNPTSFGNIARFLSDNKIPFTNEESGGKWTITVNKSTLSEKVLPDTEDYCVTSIPHFAKGDFIIAVTSDKMGDGPEELGHLLMGNFLKAVKDLDELPGAIVFYNKGVTLGAEDSPVIDNLKVLEKMGVRMLLCATCAKYYSLEEKVKLGVLSNMYEIAQVMATAGSVVKP
jgi:selenium metabolism protein YedF